MTLNETLQSNKKMLNLVFLSVVLLSEGLVKATELEFTVVEIGSIV